MAIDEAGVMMMPLLRRTLAVRGHTPVLCHRARHRQKVSLIAALSLSPRRGKLGLHFRSYPLESINAMKAAAFIRRLLRHLRGRVILICDNGSMHKGPHIQRLLAKNRRLTMEYLPPYAPDCDPVEWLWSDLKYGQMANYVPENLDQLHRTATMHLHRLGLQQTRLGGYFRASKLRLPRKLRGTLVR